MDAETLRWALGIALPAFAIGVGYLVIAAWKTSGTLTRINTMLTTHEKLHAQHGDAFKGQDERLRKVEQKLARHSGQIEAIQ